MIKKATELDFKEKKLVMIIAGVPGIGKTTLALSAPKPLLIDLDNGVSRVEAQYRQDTAVVGSYNELMSDLKNSDLTGYESLVIDTGGKLLEMLKPVVIAEDAKNGKKDGNLSLQGYGAVKRKFSQFITFCKSLNKNLIIVFHATEVALSDDITGLRIRMEGSSKDEVWDDVDIGGFMEITGKKRTIGFSNCERYYAKGTHGIHGTYEIPNLANGAKNTFVADLFSKIKEDLNKEVKEQKAYKEVIDTFKSKIESAKTLEDINSTLDEIKNANHILTSKEELWNELINKAKVLGFNYDRATKLFNNSEPTK